MSFFWIWGIEKHTITRARAFKAEGLEPALFLQVFSPMRFQIYFCGMSYEIVVLSKKSTKKIRKTVAEHNEPMLFSPD